MKIHNNLPVSGKTIRKASRNSTEGVFGKLLESEIHPVQATNESHADTSQQPMQEAWHTLEESVSLLDKAMQCIESGDTPPRQLINDIEQLRSLLRQQVSSGRPSAELQQADTLLAVEAARIRSMQV
jgi:hypothetical protein